MFELKSAYLDLEAIDEGKWMPVGSEYEGFEIYARGLTSPDAEKLRNHLRRTAPKSDRESNGKISEEAEDNILRTVVARECVKDWRGIYDDGKPVPFTPETLEGLMKLRDARKIASAIVNTIVALENTTVAAEETVSGNSEAS